MQVERDVDCVDARQQTSTCARESHFTAQGAVGADASALRRAGSPIPTCHGNKSLARQSGARSQSERVLSFTVWARSAAAFHIKNRPMLRTLRV